MPAIYLLDEVPYVVEIADASGASATEAHGALEIWSAKREKVQQMLASIQRREEKRTTKPLQIQAARHARERARRSERICDISSN
jgi:hypothetical protein